MKKQSKKLNLAKRTISNLETAEMSRHVGGQQEKVAMAKVRFTRNRFCNSF